MSDSTRATAEPRSLDVVRRELRVAFSPRVQPLWVRIGKWVVIVGVSRRLRRAGRLPVFLGGILTVGTTVHFVYRHKTRGWTRPWGGWDDLDATRPRARRPVR